jgi:hypothetical protein
MDDPSLDFTCKIKQGETLETLAKRFHVANWRIIYDYPANAALRKKRPDPNSVQPGDVVVVPAGNVLPITSGMHIGIQSNVSMFWDGHMHIQSNNCSPLPVQWGILAQMLKIRLRKNRKDLADLMDKEIIKKIVGRLGPIGRLPTDLVARLYMHELDDALLREDDAWIVMKKKETFDADKMGTRANLTVMNNESTGAFEQFENKIWPYYGDNTIFRMQCVQTFDMTFSHYWGRWGIPVYIPDSNNLYFINDYVRAGYSVTSPQNQSYDVTVNPNVVAPLTTISEWKKKYQLYSKQLTTQDSSKIKKDEPFSFKKQFEQFLAYQGNPGNKTEPFFIHFDGDIQIIQKLISKKFVHLVEPIFPEEELWQEKYFEEQLPLSEGAAVNFPLNFLLFYHYDPRCHSNQGVVPWAARAKELSDSIVCDHAFFTFYFDKSISHIQFKDNSSIAGKLVLTPVKNLNTQSFWEKILIGKSGTSDKGNLRSNSIVFEKLLQETKTGIYWGIKMYPRLGYDPSDFSNYPHLHELYDKCIKKKIPLLAHCSNGGMTIADYYNYVRYDLFDIDEEHFSPSNAEFIFTNTFASSDNWRKVLDYKDTTGKKSYSKLKLCLAHFGGFPMWEKVGSFIELENLPPSNDKKEQEKQYIYKKWIRSMVELIQNAEYGNVYTDLACFTLPGNKKDLKLFADNLVFLLNKFSKLKDRLLVGTDWPMVEMEPKVPFTKKFVDIGIYMDRMMQVFKEVSFQLKFDAWHQFGTINQLRFMGLLDETGVEMKVNVSVLDDYKERLKKMLNDEKWKKKSQAVIDVNGIEKGASVLLNLKTYNKEPIIPIATEIKVNNELTILKYTS